MKAEDLTNKLGAAYLQIKYAIGGYNELLYPDKIHHICSALLGDMGLYIYDNSTPQKVSPLVEKALSRFKSIK